MLWRLRRRVVSTGLNAALESVLGVCWQLLARVPFRRAAQMAPPGLP